MSTEEQRKKQRDYKIQWNQEHPEERRGHRNKYYDKGAVHKKNSKKQYTVAEEKLIISDNRPPDLALSQILGRTVRAIERKRHGLLKKAKNS